MYLVSLSLTRQHFRVLSGAEGKCQGYRYLENLGGNVDDPYSTYTCNELVSLLYRYMYPSDMLSVIAIYIVTSCQAVHIFSKRVVSSNSRVF